MKSRGGERAIGPAYHPKTPTPTPSRALPGQAWNRKRLWRCVGKQEVTVGSGCLCSVPLPLLVNSSPAFYGDLVSPQPHPLPALGLVGSWILLLDLSFLVWEGLAHMQAGRLGPRQGRKITWLSAAAPRAGQVRWHLSPSRRELTQPPSSSPTLTATAGLQLGRSLQRVCTLFFPSTNSVQVSRLSMGLTASWVVTSLQSRHCGMRSLCCRLRLPWSPERQGQIRNKDREDLNWG